MLTKNDLAFNRSPVVGYSLSGQIYLPKEHAVVVERGSGPHVFDMDGRRYIDFLTGSGAVLSGHAHPEVVAAVTEQVGKGTHYYVLNSLAIELAEALCTVIPCAEEVKFLTSGSEATMTAIRLARAYTGRTKILKFEGAFHGSNDYALSNSFRQVSDFPNAQPDSIGIPKAVTDTVLVSRWNDWELTESIITGHACDLAAVIAEPVQRSSPAVEGFLENLRELTERHGIVLVFDEMVTGFRMSLGGAQPVLGVVPDLAIFGKAMTNGMPMTCLVGSADVMSYARPLAVRQGKDAMFFGGTLNGNPLGAAAGLAVLKILGRDGVHDHLRRIVAALADALHASASRYGLDIIVDGPGVFFQLFFGSYSVTDFASSMATDRISLELFFVECLSRGLITNHGKFYPSIATTMADVEEAASIMDQAMHAVAVARAAAV